MRAFVSDPIPGAEQKLDKYLNVEWPIFQKIGLVSGASLSNYKFVGATLDGVLGEVDFVQEVKSSRTFQRNKSNLSLECTRAHRTQA